MLAWPWGGQIARVVIGKERVVVPENQGHEQYWSNPVSCDRPFAHDGYGQTCQGGWICPKFVCPAL